MQVVVDWLYSGVITICMWILSLVKTILNLIFDIANISFFSEDVIGSIATRVYIIVGVLMLFKITISCIQYLISPDKAEDKENGFGGIIKRALISIALLALVPSIFNFAKSAQNAILDALPKVILGQENTSNIDEIGESIAYTTTLSFFGYSSEQCNDGSIGGLEGANSNPTFSSIDDILKNVREVTTAKCNGEKRYSFNWLLCIPAAIFLVVILVSMTVDVGIRVIKFGFLEIIAPIPVASYIDPKTSKKSFDSWVHNSISVYADLFIRLGVIYLVLHLFMILLPSFSTSFTLNDGTKLTWGRSMLVNVAIVISLFFFAKNAPKFICEVLGIKGDGNIGDMFKRAGALGALGLGAARDTKAAYTNKLNKLKKANGEKLKSGDRGKALRAALKTTGSSLKGGARAVLGGKGFKDTMSASMSSAARGYGLRETLEDEGVSKLAYYKQVWNKRMGINTHVDSANAEIEAGKSASDSAKAALDFGHTNATAKFANVRFDSTHMSTEVENKLNALPNELVVGLDASGNEVKINKNDLITTYRRDASGNLVVDKAAKYTIAEIQGMLKSVANSDSDRYAGVNDVYKTRAGSLLDMLNGIGDMYMANNATTIPEMKNPNYTLTITKAVSEFMKHSGDTDFGREIIQEAKEKNWMVNGEVVSEHIGDFLSLVKSKGLNIQEKQTKVIGKQGAELVAKSIADKYDKKGS